MADYVLLAVLLAFSAFFSGSETALFSLQRQQLAAWSASPNPLRRLARRLLTERRDLLLTILLGNLFVNVTFYAVASTNALALAREGHALQATALGLAAPATVILFGEVTPKVVALGFTEFLAAAAAPLLWAITWLLWPVRTVLGALTQPMAAALVDPRARPPHVTVEELKMLIAQSEERGLIDRREGLLMRELVDFSRVTVREVMVPRVDLAMFRRGRPREEFLDLLHATGHRRIPVYGSSPDDVVGILDAREVLLHPDRTLDDLLQKAWFVPETKSVESLLAEFRLEKKTSAVVVDEYGGTAGLATLEDVVEAIVGDIHDEHDRPETPARACGENCFVLSGRTPVADWADMFGLRVEERRPATLGGLVLLLLGRLPKEGEEVRYGNVRFTITRVRGRSVEEVLVECTEPAGSSGERPSGGKGAP